MDNKKNVPVREYLTVLLRRRSVIALCCVTITLILALYGIIDGVIRENTVLNENGEYTFASERTLNKDAYSVATTATEEEMIAAAEEQKIWRRSNK